MSRKKGRLRSALSYIYSFILFFAIIAFVVTCSLLLFLNSVELQEAEVRRIAPVVFINVFILAALFLVVDTIRRRLTVDRSAREIQRVLQRLTEGDFYARVSVALISDRYHRFSELGESINLLADELSGVETLRTDFIANVSHELKTPLAVMQNYGRLLQQPGLSEEQRMEYAKTITESSRRMADLISNILKLNKLENQQIFPSYEEYDLGEQLCECLLQFEDAWENKNINIETDIPGDVIISSDKELLSLVWNNLFSNAIKFTPEGGTVSVSIENDEESIEVKVADTGCGMTAEVGMHIFEKFYQGDTSRAAKGNGLGLALVKRVMDIVHGEIKVESKSGVGSVFAVKIMRKQNEKSGKNM